MQTSLKPDIEQLGDAYEVSANQRFVARGPDRMWVVLEGALDIFLQDMAGGEFKGPRRHVMRLGDGKALFSVADDSESVLVASPAPGTRLVATSRARLQPWLRDDSIRGLFVSWTEGWAMELAAASGRTVPKKFLPLRPADHAITDGEPQVVAPVEGVLWVRHSQGSSRFLAMPELPAAHGAYFPVSKNGWLEAQPGSSLEVVTTHDWTELDPSWDGLQHFHRTVLACLALKRHDAEQREEQRLRDKAEATSSSLHRAFCWFAGAIDERRAAGLEEQSHSDALVRVCEAVGSVLQVRISCPADLRSNSRYGDPVAAIARASSVRCRQVMLGGKWWRQDGGPLIAFRNDDNRPVALLPRSTQSYFLLDPSDGSKVHVNARIAATLSGSAYSFYRPFPEEQINLKRLFAFSLGLGRRDIYLILLMGFAGGLLNLALPIGVGMMFDTATPSAQRGMVVAISAFLIVSAISAALFSVTRNLALLRLEGKLNATLQAAAWDRLLRLGVPFFRNYSSGDLAIRSLAFNEIAQVLTGPVLSLIISQCFSVISLALLFVYSWQLALIGIALLLIAMAVSGGSMYLYLQHTRVLTALRGRVTSTVIEFMNGISKFRVAGAEGRAFAVWARAVGDRRRMMMKARKSALISFGFNSGFPVLCSALIFYAAAKLVGTRDSTLTTGTFLAFFAVFNQVVAAGLQFGNTLFPLLGIVPTYERVKPLLEATPEVISGKAPPGELTGLIEGSHITFRYREGGPAILNDMSFSIPASSMVAIVGPSGCGKSTLLRLLLGFEKPESGAVFFDGQDLASLDVQAVRRQMGVVLQSGKIGSGNLYTLIVGSLPLTMDDAWEAARLTGLDKDIDAMPMGMHTVIGEGGGTLSGGQRQRLMIARAIVSRPRILLFDEATSALDNETQAIVTKSLESLRATRVVIAHRLSTIIHADRILVFDKGSVVQEGSYEELMSISGPFRDLASRQLA